jgi:hydrogenase/urease accessory protein HupE
MTADSPLAPSRNLATLVAAAVLGLATLVWQASTSAAHEVRPSYLELRELSSGEFAVLLKTPMNGDLRLRLEPSFSASIERVSPVLERETGDASVRTWRIRALEPLRGRTVAVNGLQNTMTDALVRVTFADGTSWTRRLTPQEPSATIPAGRSVLSVATLYLKLGVEHILLGIDHLLFVLGLFIVAREKWRLVKTVTSFTAAHSVTLALATLDYVHVPPAPVEAAIALSIVFVATEIVRGQQGGASLTMEAPWVVAFLFGLLHGLGFAGALSDIGLPGGDIPLALVFFNLGVEAGQLLFIAMLLSAVQTIRALRPSWPRWTGLAAPYAIGSIAAFWTIERIAAF